MLLPYSDELDIGHLSRLFDNTTNCYKFFWFQAILRKVDGEHNRFSFDELMNEMIADAWYMVTEYHLRLGPLGITDNLEEAVKYIHGNYGFISSEKIIRYLQNKNPSVPGIADKIEAPVARDIDRVRKYWKLIIQIDSSLKDIYGEVALADKTISIDHFVPWQYVAHDELWNLHPTTRSINSGKSNSLPSWMLYFNALGELEYRAYELKSQNELVAHEFQKIAPYHLNNQEIRNQLYADGLDRAVFKERLEHVIRPVYESAQTQGFKEWIYNECSSY